jgi:hypothetical protein
MNPTKENAPAATRAVYPTILRPDYKSLPKKYPSYGRQLMETRLAGKMPAGRVIVTFDWDLGRAYNRIVLPEDPSSASLSYVYLAGLSVEIVYGAKHSHLISELVETILRVNPSCLITFALDLIDTGNAVTVIKPYQLEQIAEAA